MARSRFLRRVTLVLIGCLLLLGAIVAVLHTAPARVRVLDAMLSRVAPDGTIRVAELDYALHRLRFELRGVSLLSADDPRPWLEADRLVVQLPWSALFGELSFREVLLENPRVTVFTDADGSSNLSGESTRIETPIRIGRLAVEGLELHWQDAAMDWALDAEAIDLELRQEGLTASSLEVGAPIRLRYGESRFAAEREAGRLGWNGLDLLLDRLRVGGAVGTLSVDGRIDQLLADRELNLRSEADLDLALLADALAPGSPISGRISVEADVRGPLAGDSPGLRLDLSATADALGWRSLRIDDLRLVGRLDERLRIDELTAAIAGGRISGTAAIALTADGESHFETSWNGVAVDRLQSAIGFDGSPALRSRSDGELRLDWSGAVPEAATAAATLSARLLPGTGDLALGGNLEAALSAGDWLLDGELRAPGTGRLAIRSLTGTVDADSSLAGGYELTVDDLAAARDLAAALMGPDFDMTYSLAGAGVVEGTLGGDLSEPTSSGSVRIDALRVAESEPITAEADFDVDRGELRLRSLVVSTPTATVSGSLVYALESGRVEGALRTPEAGLSLAALLELLPPESLPASTPEIDGRLTFDLRLAGGLPLPLVEGELQVDGLRVAEVGPGRLEVRFEASADSTRIERAVLLVDGARAEVGGLIGPGGDNIELTAELDVDDLAALFADPSLAELRRLRVAAGIGYETANGRLSIDLRESRVELAGRPFRLERPARLTWDGDTFATEELEARLDDFRLTASGTLGATPAGEAGREPLRIDVVGELDRIQEAVGLLLANRSLEVPELELEGSFAASAVLRGTLERPVPEGRLELHGGRMGLPGRPPIEDVEALLEVDTERVRLETFSARLAGATLTASGQTPLALLPVPIGRELDDPVAELRVDFGSVSAATLAAWLPDTDLSRARLDLAGYLDLRATALDDPAAISGELVATELRVGSDEVDLEQLRPTRLTVGDGRLRVASWEWRRGPDASGLGTSRLGLEGTVDLTGERRLDLVASGDLRLEALAPLLPAGAAIAGRLDLAVELTGTLTQPTATGTIDVAELTARMDSPRIAVTDVSGSLTFRDGSLSAGEGLRGRLNGGQAQLFVEIDLSDPTDPRGLAGLTARTVPFRVAGVSVNSDLDLSMSVRGADDIRVFGTVELLEGGYRTEQSLARVVREAAAASLAASSAPSSASLLESIVLDIQVRSSEELILDAPFVTASTAVDLRITGTAARPGAVGELDLREGGRLFLNGVNYSLDRGRLEFTESTRIAPTIDLQAGTRIAQYEIDLTISGDAFAPSVEATSNPSLGQADVLSLMATGRTLADAGAQTGQVLREQAFSMLTGQLRGVTNALGLEAVRLEQGQTVGANPFERPDETDLFPRTTELATRLTLARRITDWFQLAFSQNLGETGGQSWVGTVDLLHGIQARAGTFDDGTRSLDLRHGLVFGRAPEEARRPDPVRIDSVEIEGDTGLAPERLRERLSLAARDTFDFIDWQRDQDRLRRLLVEAGYREARLRASREVAGALGADGRARAYVLRYDVDAGPLTRLTVTGVTLDREAMAALEQTWVEAVTTEFLLNDLERVARRELIEAGWLRPSIAVELVAVEPVKEIRMAVEPGARVDRTRLAFGGNASVPASILRERLRLEEALQAVWFEPVRATDAVEDLYRERGWLRAEARTESVSSQPGSMRLVVAEGPRFTIGSVSVEGASALPTAEVEAAARGVVGEPFEAITVDTAVAAVIERYLAEAYNDVRVTSSTELVPDSASVRLTLDVREGPRHRLRDVLVAGRHRTRAGIVDRAIDARIGEFVGARTVERIRQQLLKVGAFRSVTVELTSLGPPSDGEQPVRLDVSLVELPSFRLRYGFQLLDLPEENGRRTRPGLSALLTHENAFGIGATASLLARGRKDELFGRSSLSFRRLFGLPIRTTLLAQQSQRDISRPFDLPPVRRTETVLQLSQSAEVGTGLVVGYSFNYERSIAEDPVSPFPAVPTRVTRLSPLVVYDTRDDLFDPSRGLFHSSTLEMSLAGLGSDLPFLKYTSRQAIFVPVGGIVLASSVRFGTGRSLQEGVDTLDSSEFYFAGGANTVRGYPEDSLGRTPFFGSFLPGGDAVLVANQEIRFPVWGWVEGVAFFDAGRTFTSVDEISLGALASSVGAGVRLVTPYVILRLDYGRRLSAVDGLPDAPSGRFHFGIGHIF